MVALLEAGAAVDKTWTYEGEGTEGCLALICAAAVGGEAAVAVLLEAGADVNLASDDGCTPLLMAAQWGHEAALTALLRGGAEVGLAPNDSFTPSAVSDRRKGPCNDGGSTVKSGGCGGEGKHSVVHGCAGGSHGCGCGTTGRGG